MELTLNVLRCPDSVVPETRRVPGGEFRIGRGAECDWVLPDPDRVLSKQHCVLEFRSGGWQVRDTSTNGTFHNGASMPIGRDLTAFLQDGDRLRLGSYEIEVRVQQGAAQHGAAQPGLAQQGWSGGAPAGNSGWPAQGQGQPPAWDAPMPASQNWGADPGWGGQPQAGPQRNEPIQPRLPGDPFALGGPESAPMGSSGPGGMIPADFRLDEGPVMPDHISPLNEPFLPPKPMQQVAALPEDWDRPLSGTPQPGANAAPPLGVPAPGGPVQTIPENWDLGFGTKPVAPPVAAAAAPLPVAAAAAPLPVAPTAAPPPPPVGRPVVAPVPAATEARRSQAAPPPPAGAAANPFDNEMPIGAPRPDAQSSAMPAAAVPAAAMAAVTAPRASPAIAAVAPPPAHPVAGGDDALGAFLAGAGLAPLPALSAHPDATLRAAGAALRAAIAGIRALLIARGDVKREFRIEQTMLGAAHNNPLKFSVDDDAALVALLGSAAGGPGAVRQAVDDLTAHQLATLAATQAAARALLDRLAPAGLEAAEQGGGGLFGASREKRLWDAYKKLHEQVIEQFDDDFDSAFGKSFARAYEQALREGRG